MKLLKLPTFVSFEFETGPNKVNPYECMPIVLNGNPDIQTAKFIPNYTSDGFNKIHNNVPHFQ